MSCINKVSLMGYLGANPETRHFQNGGRVCNMRIATSDKWKDRQSGETREKTEWHNVTIFSEPLAKLAANYLKKGSRVYLEGRLETRKWKDSEDVERWSTEIVMRPFQSEMKLLDRKPGEDDSQQEEREDFDDIPL